MTEIKKSLDSFLPNEWRVLLSKGETLEEKRLSIFKHAVNTECLESYKYRPPHLTPTGFISDTKLIEKLKKPETIKEAWIKFNKKYAGFIKVRYETDSTNRSNLFFLKEMLEVFKKAHLKDYAGKVQATLGVFQK